MQIFLVRRQRRTRSCRGYLSCLIECQTSSGFSGVAETRLKRWKTQDERYLQSFVAFQDCDLQEVFQPHLWRSVYQTWRENDAQRHKDEAPTGEQLAQKLYADVKTTLESKCLRKWIALQRLTAWKPECRFSTTIWYDGRLRFQDVHKLSNEAANAC